MPLSEKNIELFKSVVRAGQSEMLAIEDSIDEFRAAAIHFYQDIVDQERVDGVNISRSSISGPDGNTLNLCIYTPINGEKHKPGVVFFPGGGFVLDLGDLYNSHCSKLASQAGVVVIKVSCRLAPEVCHASTFSDAYHAAKHIYQNAIDYGIDCNRFGIAGNSSGGNFAALVTHKARTEVNGPAIKAQFLINPRVDVSFTSGGIDTYRDYEEQDLLLTKSALLTYRNCYLPKNQDPKDPSVSPYYDDVSGLPYTFLMAGEYDGARGDTEIYAEKLQQAGVEVEKYIIEGQTHHFFLAEKVLTEFTDPIGVLVEAVKKGLHSQSHVK